MYRKSSRTAAIAVTAILLASAAGGAFAFLRRNTAGAGKSGEKVFDADNIGELYCSPVDPENIAYTSDGIAMFADNELLISAKEDVSKSDIEKLASKYDAEIVGFIEQTGDYQLRFSDKMNEDELTAVHDKLLESGYVDSCGLNFVSWADTCTIKKGKEYENKENIFLRGAASPRGMWGHEYINAPAAWSYMEQSGKVVPVNVGVIDDGFYSHKDLAFAELGQDEGHERDHGTHVCGTFAAIGDNDEGICGVYPYGKDRLYAFSIYSISNITEQLGDRSPMVSSMAYKLAFGSLIFKDCKVINMSLGFCWHREEEFTKSDGTKIKCQRYKLLTKEVTSNSPLDKNTSLRKFMDYIYDNPYYREQTNQLAEFLEKTRKHGYDFVIVNSGGNESHDSIHYDSKSNSFLSMIREDEHKDIFDRIIVCGSVGRDFSYNDISDFSNAGERTDIYAPGYMICSCLGYESYGGDDLIKALGESIFSEIPGFGTSMSAPHVAGVCADIYSIGHGLSGADVKQIALNSYRSDSKDGYKIIDALKAVMTAERWNGEGNSESDHGMIYGFVYNNPLMMDHYDKDKVTVVADAKVSIYKKGDPKNKKTRVTTDKLGHFEAIVEPGEYIIGVESPEYGKALVGQNEDNTVTVEPDSVKWLYVFYPNDSYDTKKTEERFSIVRFDVIDEDTNEVIPYGKVGVAFVENDKQVMKDYYPFIDDGNGHSVEMKLPYKEQYEVSLSIEGYESTRITIQLGEEPDAVVGPVYVKKKKDNKPEKEQQEEKAVICFDVIKRDTNEKVPCNEVGIAFEENGAQVMQDYWPFMDGAHAFSVELALPYEYGKTYVLRVKVAGYKPLRIKIVFRENRYMIEDPVYIEREISDDNKRNKDTPPSDNIDPDNSFEHDNVILDDNVFADSDRFSDDEQSTEDFLRAVLGDNYIDKNKDKDDRTINEEWKQAYINYIGSNPYLKDIPSWQMHEYWLEDINSDGIPELFDTITGDGVVFEITAVTWSGGLEISKVSSGRSQVRIGRGLAFCSGDDRIVYMIENGQFVQKDMNDFNMLSSRYLIYGTGYSESRICDKIREW